MGVFENFPYTNFHDLNLDWILKIIKELDSEVNAFIEQNVLSYADPIDWNITTQYAKNTVVVDPVTGTAYMSIEAVPEGILLTNTSYWQPIFNYQQTVTTMKEQIAAVDFGDGNAPQDIPIYTLFWYKNVLYRALRAIDAGATVVVGTNAEHVTVEDAILAIKSAENVSRTAENIIDSATGDYTETAGDKTENYTNRTVTVTGDVLESVTGKKTVNADDIILNPINPLTYKEPTNLSNYFKFITLKDPTGNEYKVLVESDETSSIPDNIVNTTTSTLNSIKTEIIYYDNALVYHTIFNPSAIKVLPTNGNISAPTTNEKTLAEFSKSATYNIIANCSWDTNAIMDGTIFNTQTITSNRYYYVAFNKNEMALYPCASTSLNTILNAGYTDCFVSFYPIIINGAKTDYESNEDDYNNLHPRQCLGVDNSGTYHIFTVFGRTVFSIGLNYDSLYQLGINYNLTNMANLDGGGSIFTMINGELLNALEISSTDALYYGRQTAYALCVTM